MSGTGTSGTRRWLWIGALGWTVLAIVYLLSVALRGASYGRPLVPSWPNVINAFLMTLVGASLTPLVLQAFRRGPGVAARRSLAAVWYVVIGLAYWLTWALILTGLAAGGLIRVPGLTLPGAIILMAYISLAAYAVLVMLYEAVRSLREAREKELEAARLQVELSRAQAAMLRARLNPDFLFDTLTTAAELMEDARAARRVLADLGVLLRASLGRNGKDLVSCQEELDLLQRYLDIQRARPGTRLRVRIEMGPAAAASSLPPLVLQPVVEGMLRRGAAAASQDIVLDISATRVGSELRLRLRVTGSGPGLGRGGTASRADSDLDPIRDRLEAVYGDQAWVNGPRPVPAGIEVEIRVPAAEDGDG